MLKNLTLTKCQGTRWNGDNPLVHIQTPTYTIYSPTFSHHFLYGYSVMTIFFPLTLSGRPLFYYICFPDKKGMPSGIGGGTNVVSVRRPLLSPSRREPIYYMTPQLVTKCPHFIVKTTKVGNLFPPTKRRWENVGTIIITYRLY